MLLITMAAAWLVASGAGACRPPSGAEPRDETSLKPVPIEPEAILEFQIPDTTDPKEPPSPFPEPKQDEEPTVATLRGGAQLGHGGAAPGSVEVPPATTTSAATTTSTTTATTTTGSGIEVSW